MNGALNYVKVLGQQSKRKFGKVMLVEDQETNQQFILKTATKSQISERALDQLRNEAAFSFQLERLPTVALFEETESSISILLNYKQGVPLNEFWKSIRKKDRLPFTKSFVSKLLYVLDHIHEQQIYHCDLKPSNILIDGTIESFEIHLIDFGLAIDKKNFVDRKLIFPLGFAAPELLLNRMHLIDHTTDYFALGVLIYFLWSDELPLSHANPSIFTNLQLAHPIQDHHSMPKGLNNWIQKLCVKPNWPTAPNLMPADKIDDYLQKVMTDRINTSTTCMNILNEVTPKRWHWFN